MKPLLVRPDILVFPFLDMYKLYNALQQRAVGTCQIHTAPTHVIISLVLLLEEMTYRHQAVSLLTLTSHDMQDGYRMLNQP